MPSTPRIGRAAMNPHTSHTAMPHSSRSIDPLFAPVVARRRRLHAPVTAAAGESAGDRTGWAPPGAVHAPQTQPVVIGRPAVGASGSDSSSDPTVTGDPLDASRAATSRSADHPPGVVSARPRARGRHAELSVVGSGDRRTWHGAPRCVEGAVSEVFRDVDLTGVFANAVLGGVIARHERLDPIGFAALAIMSGLGGGAIRDTLLQHGTPIALTDARPACPAHAPPGRSAPAAARCSPPLTACGSPCTEVAYTYWGIGGTDPDTYRAAEAAGTLSRDLPVNHSARFAPVIQPTLDTGTEALVTAALAWLAPTPSPAAPVRHGT
ncbi:trimeric intracellular cation channel family protein [Pseudonocardia sp. T1-2H]|uniref:trimeric intracellular cation channel family protein n=1 Tax=Pseudonocardia sp. T1-2H TaxID=3128899 RepID=UPI0031011A81